MRIAGLYSFNNGRNIIESNYKELLGEISDCITTMDSARCRTKASAEKTMAGRMLFSPVLLHQRFKANLSAKGWNSIRVSCEYPTHFYVESYKPKKLRPGAFREMDFVKRKLGIEVQFGKYSFMVYNVAAKMTILRNLGYIEAGIEIVSVKAFADEMSTGVSYFEQFVWDLEKRGIADIDIPVLVIGIDA